MSEARLFFQMQAFGDCRSFLPLFRALNSSSLDAALYTEVSDPKGVGLLAISEDTEQLTEELHELLGNRPFSSLTRKPSFARLGVTEASTAGQEESQAVLDKTRQRVLNPSWPWAIWYALRYRSEFSALPENEQRRLWDEHGVLVGDLAEADLAHYVRLGSFGLDRDGNDVLIGIVGKELHEISDAVERLRGTELASRYVDQRGPLFLGKAIWQTGAEPATRLERGARW